MKTKRNFFRSLVLVLGLAGMGSVAAGNPVAAEAFYQQAQIGSTVYITPHGECYHRTSKCRTLSRSRNIQAVDKSSVGNRRACRVCY